MKDDVLSMQIEQARNGDEQAIAGLIARQMPQIRSLAAKAVRPGLDFDDAVQEGIIGLFSALETLTRKRARLLPPMPMCACRTPLFRRCARRDAASMRRLIPRCLIPRRRAPPAPKSL